MLCDVFMVSAKVKNRGKHEYVTDKRHNEEGCYCG